MCLDHCRAPDHLQHERAKTEQALAKAAAYRAGHVERPPLWTRPPYNLDISVQVARMQLQWHIDTLVEQAKDQMFWNQQRGFKCKNS